MRLINYTKSQSRCNLADLETTITNLFDNPSRKAVCKKIHHIFANTSFIEEVNDNYPLQKVFWSLLKIKTKIKLFRRMSDRRLNMLEQLKQKCLSNVKYAERLRESQKLKNHSLAFEV